jgi:hypothetical protein
MLARPSVKEMRFIVVVALAAGFLGACNKENKETPAAAVDAAADHYAPQPKPTSSTPEHQAMPAASVEAMVNPRHLPVYDGPTGSLEGTVTITGDPSPETKNRDYTKCPAGAEAYRKLFREGPPRADGSRPLPDALVVVTGYGGFLPEQRPARLVTIDNCMLSSRAIDMTIGQKIDFQNLMKDKIFAPAFIQEPSVLALVAPPGGDPVSLYPHEKGVLTLFDRFGAGSGYLSADVYVFVQPLHTVSDLGGHYRIDGIPVGDVRVEGILAVVAKETTKGVTIHPNVVETLDLQLEYTTPKEAPQWDAGRRPKIIP